MQLKSILVTAVAPMSAHIANAGDKILGNMSSIKKLPDNRAYISGQKQRHALFEAIKEINDDPKTYVSRGEAISNDLATDLRADLGGYMHPAGEAYIGKRVAPVSATFAIADKPSDIFSDLLQKLSAIPKEMTIAHREVSQKDEMVFAFHLDIPKVGVRTFENFNEDGHHISSRAVAFISKEEKLRRIKLFLRGATSLTAYSHSARNMVSGEPTKILITLDPTHLRKALRYFQSSREEQSAILTELESRGAKYFIGDDKTENTVAMAISLALEALEAAEIEHPNTVSKLEDFTRLTEAALLQKVVNTNKRKKKSKAVDESNTVANADT